MRPPDQGLWRHLRARARQLPQHRGARDPPGAGRPHPAGARRRRASPARAPPRWSIRRARASPNAWPRSRARRVSAWRRSRPLRCQPCPPSRKTSPQNDDNCVRGNADARRAERMAVTPTGRERPAIAAEAFLRALADHGVDYFFCNPGTDFPPIVEAFGRAKKTNAKVPKPDLGAAREPGGRHGAWRLSDDRPPAGGDGACQCRHRQHHQQSHQPVARPRAARSSAPGARRSPKRARSARARGRSTGRRKCSTRPACCANW